VPPFQFPRDVQRLGLRAPWGQRRTGLGPDLNSPKDPVFPRELIKMFNCSTTSSRNQNSSSIATAIHARPTACAIPISVCASSKAPTSDIYQIAKKPSHVAGEHDSLSVVTSAEALPDNPDLLKAMLLAERAESERLRQIIKELQRHRYRTPGREPARGAVAARAGGG